MNNYNFDDTSFLSREKRLLDILEKRTYGQLDRRILLNIIKRLDLSKQVEIEVVGKDKLDENIILISDVIKNGETVYEFRNRKSTCLLGSVKFGFNKKVSDEDGYVFKNVSSVCEVKQYPLVVETVTVSLDDKDFYKEIVKNKLVVCMSGF